MLVFLGFAVMSRILEAMVVAIVVNSTCSLSFVWATLGAFIRVVNVVASLCKEREVVSWIYSSYMIVLNFGSSV